MFRVVVVTVLLAIALLPASGPAAGQEDDSNESPYLKQGESWEMAFPLEATITYHCHPHDWMIGTIRVSATHPDAKDRVEVQIEGFNFTPKEIWVKPGGVVNWTNRDVAEHNVMFIRFEAGDPNAAPAETPGPAPLAALALAAAVALLVRRRPRLPPSL